MQTLRKTDLKVDQAHGGDLWNTHKLMNIVFNRFPDITSFQCRRTSGLYCTIYVSHRGDFDSKVYTVYDTGRIISEKNYDKRGFTY